MLSLFEIKKEVYSKTISIVCGFLLLHSVNAQVDLSTQSTEVFTRFADPTSRQFDSAQSYYIGAWDTDIPNSTRFIRKLNERTAIIKITDKHVFDSLKQIISLSATNHRWKYSPFAERIFQQKANEELQVILSSPDIELLLTRLEKFSTSMKFLFVDQASNSVVVRTNAKTLKESLLPLNEIIFIDIRAVPHAEISIIGYNRSFHGINEVDYGIPGANGKNIVAGVKEQKMDPSDIDLYKRVLASPLSSSNITSHATVISSIIGGAGNSLYDGRGIANSCSFFPSTFDNLFADDATILNANKVTVQNHSYGTVIQQFYGAEAVSYDVSTWQNKNLVHVFSAGNQGTAAAGDGKYANITGYANLTGNFKMAKNIITVGAIDNKGIIPAESSSGPLYDGRLAPQLIALGPNGTSDAAAVVTGTVAVMQQVYKDSNSQSLPPASLIKAVLYNTADDIFKQGIDYKTGYGLLNSFAAIKSIQQKEYDGGLLFQGQQWTSTISVPPNAAQLKVTLAWTDTAASVNNNKTLLNDLDMELIQLSNGMIYKPWVLSPAANIDSLSKFPIRKRDSLNTAEQVSISLPPGGNYQLRITGYSIVNSPLAFHIAWHIDTLNTYHFSSPQHTSDVNRVENPNLDIRWKTFVADSNQTGNLYISYNSGVNWQLLKAAHKIYTNYFQWPVRDTSSRAVLKMETGFGDFLSKEFIISKVTKPNVDFLCADSFRLSWTKHIYATGYKIFSLTDSPYLRPVQIVSDTFLVMKRSLYPWLVYAIEPILNINVPAARSIAIDITAQAVKCFYKTLYYTLLDQNKLDLVLELSAPVYVDSILFERVTQGGQRLQSYGSITANSNNSIYDQIIDDVPGGTSYWRARIKLKDGSLIYTDIISVLTTGKKFILFYPNPVDRDGTLIYLLRQNLPTDSRLQLFDAGGRLLRNYPEIPNTINMKSFATGIIIYKLFSNNNRLLETGKIMVR